MAEDKYIKDDRNNDDLTDNPIASDRIDENINAIDNITDDNSNESNEDAEITDVMVELSATVEQILLEDQIAIGEHSVSIEEADEVNTDRASIEEQTASMGEEDEVNDKASLEKQTASVEQENEVSTDPFSIEEQTASKGETAAAVSKADAVSTADHKSSNKVYSILRIVFIIGFFVFLYLFIDEMFIQPYRTNKAIEKTQDLYKRPETDNDVSAPAPTQLPITSEDPDAEGTETKAKEPVVIQDPNRDSQGRLLQFSELLELNPDVKGWIRINDSIIDYVVMQSGDSNDPEYYLTRNMFHEEVKAGSIFLDYKSSVLPGKETQNLVVHGHNMTSTRNMFHHLLEYKKMNYYRVRPTIIFDTIYKTGEWKIFSIFITNGSSKNEELFNYTISDFKDSEEFLEFVYQLRIRSIYNMDTVDINEYDQILTLSTCSYEVKDYRTVIVARRVREGEDSWVDVDSVTINPKPLYPNSYYKRYGGKAPKISDFKTAFEAGEIKWYKPY